MKGTSSTLVDDLVVHSNEMIDEVLDDVLRDEGLAVKPHQTAGT